MNFTLTCSIWREGDWYVSHCKELEVASQGRTIDEAAKNLLEAIELLVEDASATEINERILHFDQEERSNLIETPKFNISSTPVRQSDHQAFYKFSLDYA